MTAWREVWIWSAAGVLLTVAALVSSGSCAARQVVEARPWRFDPGAVPIRMGAPPLVRVLLAQDFELALVQGTDQASEILLRALPEGIELQPLNPAGDPVFATGFRLEPGNFQLLRLNSRPYRGVIEAFINPTGSAVIVNELSLEDYLRGVVPGELGPDAHPQLEALKAQSVAARTFTISNLYRQAHLGFDVYDDSRSQAYSGASGEHPLTDRAVEETQGRIAEYEGKPILAMYSSTCGGLTANYAEIFLASPVPYLQGGVRCKDESSPYHEWEETISAERLQRTLDQYADIGRLRRLTPGRRDATGRLVELALEGTQGRVTLHGVRLRFALGLRSNWILKIEPRLGRDGLVESLRVRGRGWGHGVGLCQWGAVEMSQRGAMFEEIMEHYFPGVRIIKRF